MIYPGAMYGDALVTGETVLLFPRSHMELNGQRVEFPKGEAYGVLYPVLASSGQKFVGQEHDGGLTAEWDGADWHFFDPPNGTYGAAYDGQDALQIIVPGPNVSSQGYRNIGPDGRLVMGDATYAPKHGVSQWTDIGDDILIGQGHDVDGAVVWCDGLRRLDAAYCWPVRARRRGEDVVITYSRPDGVVVWRGTVADLRALPLVSTPAPPPPVVVPPVPQPKPKSEPVPMPTNQIDVVKRIRDEYPTPLTDWRCIVRVAQAIGAKVFRKDGGDHIFLEPLNLYISRTIIGQGTLGNSWVKVFADGEGKATPIWSVGDTPADGEYLDVSGINTGQSAPSQPPSTPPQEPPPVVQQPPVVLPDYGPRLAAIEASILRLAAAIENLRTPPAPAVVFPDYSAKVPYLGTVTLKPVK